MPKFRYAKPAPIKWYGYFPAAILRRKYSGGFTFHCQYGPMCLVQYFVAYTSSSSFQMLRGYGLQIFFYSLIKFLGLLCFDAVGWTSGRASGLKNWAMRCWCGYLSAARCRLLVYGPADATASPKPHHLFPQLYPDWFYLSGNDLPRLSWKRGR